MHLRRVYYDQVRIEADICRTDLANAAESLSGPGWSATVASVVLVSMLVVVRAQEKAKIFRHAFEHSRRKDDEMIQCHK